MFTGPVGPVEVFFYLPEAVFWNFYWPGAIGSPLASSPDIVMCRNCVSDTLSVPAGNPSLLGIQIDLCRSCLFPLKVLMDLLGVDLAGRNESGVEKCTYSVSPAHTSPTACNHLYLNLTCFQPHSPIDN